MGFLHILSLRHGLHDLVELHIDVELFLLQPVPLVVVVLQKVMDEVKKVPGHDGYHMAVVDKGAIRPGPEPVEDKSGEEGWVGVGPVLEALRLGFMVKTIWLFLISCWVNRLYSSLLMSSMRPCL